MPGFLNLAQRESAAILLVGHLFQPVGMDAVKRLLHGDMCHRRFRGSTVPVLFISRKRDDVAGPDLLYRPAPALREAGARDDVERLAKRMGVPMGARAGLETGPWWRASRAGASFSMIGVCKTRPVKYFSGAITVGTLPQA